MAIYYSNLSIISAHVKVDDEKIWNFFSAESKFQFLIGLGLILNASFFFVVDFVP